MSVCPVLTAKPAPYRCSVTVAVTLEMAVHLEHRGPPAYWTRTPGSASLWWMETLALYSGLSGQV